MAENDRRTAIPGAVHDFVAQLRGVTDRLSNLAGMAESLPALPGLPAMPNLPRLPGPPGRLTAAQLKAMASAVTAMRGSIGAMTAQLSAFDEQLEVLEQILGPLTEWTQTWADLEKRVLDLRPGTDG